MNQTINERLEALEAENKRLITRNNNAAWRYRIFTGLAATALIAAAMVIQSPPAIAQVGGSLAGRVTALEADVAALQTKTQFVSLAGGEMYITGTNLHILNGLGSTETSNTLGNLIVGYNELRGADDNRTGSHNLIVGMENNYSSYGGVVFGKTNSISGGHACVTAGSSNTARGFLSSVSGGWGSSASGPYSSVSGGALHDASGEYSAVSGGVFNVASGSASSVSGGSTNEAIAVYSAVSGGEYVMSETAKSWAAGSSAGALVYTGRFRSP